MDDVQLVRGGVDAVDPAVSGQDCGVVVGQVVNLVVDCNTIEATGSRREQCEGKPLTLQLFPELGLKAPDVRFAHDAEGEV